MLGLHIMVDIMDHTITHGIHLHITDGADIITASITDTGTDTTKDI
jgi:hypothetical protein